MSLIDLIIGIPLLYFGYKGAVNGIVKEVLNIVGIILAVFLTFKYMDVLSVIIAPMFAEKSPYIPFVSGSILFLGTMIAVAAIAYATRKTLEAAKLSIVNRVFGAAFGVLKSSMVVSAVLLLLAGFNLPGDQTRDESLLYPYVIYVGPLTYDALSALYPGASSYTETIKRILNNYNPVENLPLLDQ